MLALAGVLEFLLFECDAKRFSLKQVLIVRRIARIVILIGVTVFNFLFTFCDIKLVGHLVTMISCNVLALIYFFVDIFYLSAKERRYISWLQNAAFSQCMFDDLFEMKESNGAKYQESRMDEQQRFAIVDTGKDDGKVIFFRNGGKEYIIKPKIPMDETTLMFHARYFEFEVDEYLNDLRLYPDQIPEFVLKSYDPIPPTKGFLKLEAIIKRPKTKLILFYVFLGVVVALAISLVVLEKCGIDWKGWLDQKIG